MLSPHLPCEKRHLSPYKPFAFARVLGLWACLPAHELECEAMHQCSSLFGWGVRTGKKNISRSLGALRRHFIRRHAPTVILDMCAKRVKDLTNIIVRIDAYPVAYGGFSDVWSCQLQYKQLPPERVAVKAVRSMTANEEEFQVKKKAVEQELGIWMGLSHRNILPLYGVTHGFGLFPAFVCPWAHHGTLSEYLEKFDAKLDLKKRMTLLGDIAAGLQYLHSRNIVHGDLSGVNVLIDESGRACLSDFGLSTLVEQVSDTMVCGLSFPGNVRWAAPELFEDCEKKGSTSQLSSRPADIYSFGSIMLQTLTGKLPFHEIQRVAQIVIMVSRGKKPSRELGWDGKDIPDVLWEFVEACWAGPSERPSSKEIVNFIKEQISRL